MAIRPTVNARVLVAGILAAVAGASCIQVEQAATTGDIGITNDLSVSEPPGEPDAEAVANDGNVGTPGEDAVISTPADAETPGGDVADVAESADGSQVADVADGDDEPETTEPADVVETADVSGPGDVTEPADVVEPPVECALNQCVQDNTCINNGTSWDEDGCVRCFTNHSGVASWGRVSGPEPDNYAWYNDSPPEIPIDTLQSKTSSLNDLRCDQDWMGHWYTIKGADTGVATPGAPIVAESVVVIARYFSPLAGVAKHCVRFGCAVGTDANGFTFATLESRTCTGPNGGNLTVHSVNASQRAFGRPSLGGTEYQCCAEASSDVLETLEGENLRSRMRVQAACPAGSRLTIWHGAYQKTGTSERAECAFPIPDPDDSQCHQVLLTTSVNSANAVTPQ